MAAAAEEDSHVKALQESLPDLVRAFTRPLKHSKFTHEEALARIKRCVKQGGDAAAREAEYYIARELEQQAVEVKMRCLQLLQVLFQRSRAFRQAVAADNRQLFACVLAELSKSFKVKGSEEAVRQMRNESLRLLAQWDASYGQHLPELHVLCRYLTEVHHVQLGTAEPDATRVAELDRLLIARTSRVIRELEEQSRTIEENLDEIDATFNVLFPHIIETSQEPAVPEAQQHVGAGGVEDEEDEDEDEDEYEDVAWESADEMDRNAAMRGTHTSNPSEGYSIHDTMAILGIHNMNFVLTISLGQSERLQAQVGEGETDDTLLGHLKDYLRALRQHHVQRVAAWKTTLTRYVERFIEQEGTGTDDGGLREAAQRWQVWVERIVARINDVQQRCSDISHARQQKGQKRSAAQLESASDVSQRLRTS